MRRIASLLTLEGIVLATLAVLLLAPAARADVFDDNPATASRGPGDAWIFVRGKDGDVLERHKVNGAWTDWSSLGGSSSSGPAAAPYGEQLFVFTRGQDGTLWSRTYTNGWGEWKNLGGYITSAPAAALRRGTGYLDVVVRGVDNSFVMRSYSAGGGWTGWSSLGGAFTSGPGVGSYQDGALNVWGRGTDGALKVRGYEGAWNDWTDFGGVMLGAPGVVSRSPGFENSYVQNTERGVTVRAWVSGQPWSGWLLVDPTPIDSAPAAGGDGPDNEWLVARKGGNLLYKEWTSSASWAAGPTSGRPPFPPRRRPRRPRRPRATCRCGQARAARPRARGCGSGSASSRSRAR